MKEQKEVSGDVIRSSIIALSNIPRALFGPGRPKPSPFLRYLKSNVRSPTLHHLWPCAPDSLGPQRSTTFSRPSRPLHKRTQKQPEYVATDDSLWSHPPLHSHPGGMSAHEKVTNTPNRHHQHAYSTIGCDRSGGLGARGRTGRKSLESANSPRKRRLFERHAGC